MGRKANSACCAPSGKDASSCKVESLVSVDERGQMVLPKDLRDRMEISPGEKLAVIPWEKEGKVCCISLIKTDELVGMVKGVLGPLVKDIL